MREDDEYSVIPSYLPLPVEVDYTQHRTDNPFCYDPTCPCHEDSNSIQEVNSAYQEGLLTSNEATDFVNGKML